MSQELFKNLSNPSSPSTAKLISKFFASKYSRRIFPRLGSSATIKVESQLNKGTKFEISFKNIK